MNKEEFLGKLQMCYFGDRNAFDEIVELFDKMQKEIDTLKMKNKDIEELLNNIKDKYSYEPYDTTGKVYTTISYEEGQLLLSYIETLENRNKELYEGFMATQEELTDYATKNEQLENNRDKAIEYNQEIVDNYLEEDDCEYCDGRYNVAKKNLNILKGDSDE